MLARSSVGIATKIGYDVDYEFREFHRSHPKFSLPVYEQLKFFWIYSDLLFYCSKQLKATLELKNDVRCHAS
jgi:hypothetical protein